MIEDLLELAHICVIAAGVERDRALLRTPESTYESGTLDQARKLGYAITSGQAVTPEEVRRFRINVLKDQGTIDLKPSEIHDELYSYLAEISAQLRKVRRIAGQQG